MFCFAVNGSSANVKGSSRLFSRCRKGKRLPLVGYIKRLDMKLNLGLMISVQLQVRLESINFLR